MYLLGIDGGQTSTKACLYDQETAAYQFSSGPPVEHMLTLSGQIKSKHGIQQTLYALLREATLSKRVEMAFVSISGVHKEHEEMIKSWISECIEVDHFMVEGDVKANLAGASAGANDGVLIIAGGGSIGYYFNGMQEFVAGGYGHILDDEGSAYWIGLQALKAGIRDSERRGPATLLRERALKHFNETSFWGVKKGIHADLILRSDIAGLAPLVEQTASEGDEAARGILEQAGEELGEIAISVLEQAKARCSKGGELKKIYPTGGVFQSKWVMGSLKDTLNAYDPTLIIELPKYSPVIGTIVLAAQSLNKSIQFNEVCVFSNGGDNCEYRSRRNLISNTRYNKPD